MTGVEVFFVMVGAHFLADYPLQGEFLAKGKNKNSPIPGVPYYHPLTAHASIHGLFVGLITGSLLLGLMETILHWVIDNKKCKGELNFDQDQLLHICCKLVWAFIWAFAIS